MRAAYVVESEKVEIKDINVPALKDDEVLIKP
jgi:D-arabinose 1-dehydrogenase-like Zn-dependent alcohol dehydrogenase